MERRESTVPCLDRDVAAVAAMPVPSDHLYQLAAVAFVLFLLATTML